MRTSALFTLLAIAIAGCTSPATVVSGSVQVNNRPVVHGYISFFPLEGTKATHGAEVKDGRYQAAEIPPGQWRVQLTETQEVEVVKQRDGPPLLKMRGPRNRTSSTAIHGNPLVVEIRPGNQTLDLALKL